MMLSFIVDDQSMLHVRIRTFIKIIMLKMTEIHSFIYPNIKLKLHIQSTVLLVQHPGRRLLC